MTRWNDTRPIWLCRDVFAGRDASAARPGIVVTVLPPSRPWRGWSSWLEELTRRPVECSGRSVTIDASAAEIGDATERAVIRQIGAALYQAGASEVRCGGRRVQRAPQQQTLKGVA
jgi:hypothetical protein